MISSFTHFPANDIISLFPWMCICQFFFNHSSVDGHLKPGVIPWCGSCEQCCNKHGRAWTSSEFWLWVFHVMQGWQSRWYNRVQSLVFLRKLHTDSQRGCNNFHFHQQYIKYHFSCNPTSIYSCWGEKNLNVVLTCISLWLIILNVSSYVIDLCTFLLSSVQFICPCIT
jgi:hypothetical protein